MEKGLRIPEMSIVDYIHIQQSWPDQHVASAFIF
jgi:hypothetical protein